MLALRPWLVLLFATACAKGETPQATPSPPQAASTAPRPSSVTAAPEASAAPRPSAALDASRGDARCEGSSIDLTAVLLDVLCGAPAGDVAGAVPAGAVDVKVVAPPVLAPGAEGPLTVTLTNTTGAPLDLRVAFPRAQEGGLGLSLGAAKTPSTVTLRQSTTSSDGRRSYDAGWSVLTLIPSHALVHLAPHGTATLASTLRARGFLPGKHYDASSNSIDHPPDPLPRGHYKVTLKLATSGVADPVVELRVR